jgi:tetratricopeptide (TPR) repeat protein
MLFLIVGAFPAAADQNDPRLDDLFVMLRDAKDYGNAKGIENGIWQIWTEVDDDAVTTLMNEGLTALTAGHLKTARTRFAAAVKKRPGYAEGWNKLSTVDYLLGNYKRSLSEIEKTLDLEPRHFGALSGKGLVEHALGNDPAAIKAFQRALAINPHLDAARRNIEILQKEGEAI